MGRGTGASHSAISLRGLRRRRPVPSTPELPDSGPRRISYTAQAMVRGDGQAVVRISRDGHKVRDVQVPADNPGLAEELAARAQAWADQRQAMADELSARLAQRDALTDWIEQVNDQAPPAADGSRLQLTYQHRPVRIPWQINPHRVASADDPPVTPDIREDFHLRAVELLSAVPDDRHVKPWELGDHSEHPRHAYNTDLTLGDLRHKVVAHITGRGDSYTAQQAKLLLKFGAMRPSRHGPYAPADQRWRSTGSGTGTGPDYSHELLTLSRVDADGAVHDLRTVRVADGDIAAAAAAAVDLRAQMHTDGEDREIALASGHDQQRLLDEFQIAERREQQVEAAGTVAALNASVLRPR